jgi:cystathionine beta-lyase family protein involved in aluminum resistance
MPTSHTKHKRRHPQEVREAIKTTQLLNVLENFALNVAQPKNSKMTRDRIKAIEILLRKSMPDLQAVTVNGELKASLDVRLYMPDNGRNPAPPAAGE